MRCNWLPLEHDRVLDPGDDEVSELLGLAVKSPDVLPQSVVDQRERDDLPLSAAARNRVVLDGQRALLVNGTRDRRQYV